MKLACTLCTTRTRTTAVQFQIGVVTKGTGPGPCCEAAVLKGKARAVNAGLKKVGFVV